VNEGLPQKKFKRITDFGERILMRLRFRRFYSQIKLKTLSAFLKKINNKSYHASSFFFYIFETRLDSFFYRLNILDNSDFSSRQIFKHKFFFLIKNFEKLLITSNDRSKLGDIVTFPNKKYFFNLLLNKFFLNKVRTSIPYFYEINFRIMSVIIFVLPTIKTIFYPFKNYKSTSFFSSITRV
jgi:hypothetical protein